MANETKNPATPEPKLIALPVTMSDIMAEIEAEKTQRAALRPANKSAIFAALAGAGIATVTVNFDGYGDSGQIDSIDARDAANMILPLPDQTISIVAIILGEERAGIPRDDTDRGNRASGLRRPQRNARRMGAQ